VRAYRRDGVWASARDPRAKRSLRAAGLSDLRNPRNRSQKFWTGSSHGHYADTPIRGHAVRPIMPTRVSSSLRDSGCGIVEEE
jgi:hypothetical protein